jgi:hypothetical protein
MRGLCPHVRLDPDLGSASLGTLASAATDRLAKVTALEDEAAAPAAFRYELSGDEQRAHQGRPEDERGEDERGGHFPVIGCTRAVD